MVTGLIEEGLGKFNPHKFGTDEYFEWNVRYGASTVYHPVGTCKMGALKPAMIMVNKLMS